MDIDTEIGRGCWIFLLILSVFDLNFIFDIFLKSIFFNNSNKKAHEFQNLPKKKLIKEKFIHSNSV